MTHKMTFSKLARYKTIHMVILTEEAMTLHYLHTPQHDTAIHCICPITSLPFVAQTLIADHTLQWQWLVDQWHHPIIIQDS